MPRALIVGEVLTGQSLDEDVEVSITVDELIDPRFVAWLCNDIVPRFGRAGVRLTIEVVS